jgi:hypothetical protein
VETGVGVGSLPRGLVSTLVEKNGSSITKKKQRSCDLIAFNVGSESRLMTYDWCYYERLMYDFVHLLDFRSARPDPLEMICAVIYTISASREPII